MVPYVGPVSRFSSVISPRRHFPERGSHFHGFCALGLTRNLESAKCCYPESRPYIRLLFMPYNHGALKYVDRHKDSIHQYSGG